MRDRLAGLILERLDSAAADIKADFAPGITTRYSIVDGLLPLDLAAAVSSAFPPTGEMRLLNSFRERKFTSKSLEKFDPLIADFTFAFQVPRVIEKVAAITGIRDAVGDPNLYAGGISAMQRGHFLNPHIDNSHDGRQENYRVLNLLYYVTPDWKPQNGGNLELWDHQVTVPVEIPSLFNRLVLMETNQRSWHSVNAVRTDDIRRCVSNYYFSPHSPNGRETNHVTYFTGRPEQRFMRPLTRVDSEIRTIIRKIKKTGFAAKDTYNGPVNPDQ